LKKILIKTYKISREKSFSKYFKEKSGNSKRWTILNFEEI